MGGTTSSKTRLENEKLKREVESMRRQVHAKMGANTPGTSSRTRQQNIELKNQVAGLRRQVEAMKIQSRSTRQRDIAAAVRAAQELDLAFVFDATKSMQRYMELVKETIVDIAHSVAKTYPESHIRVGFAFYRDYMCKEYAGSLDFTRSFNGSGSTFVRALAGVKAMSGGDVPEDVFSGLEELETLSWKATNRVVYHIADAPCHGTRFHNSSIRDDYPEGDPEGRDIAVLLRKLRVNCKICSYTFLHIDKAMTAKMLREFKKAAPEGHKWIHEDELDEIDMDSILRKVKRACKASIARTLSGIRFGKVDVGGSPEFVPRQVRSDMPNWDMISQQGHEYKFKRYTRLDDLLGLLEKEKPLELEAAHPVQTQVALYPFSGEGTTHWPFYALLTCKGAQRTVMVLKRFKDRIGHDIAKLHSKDTYIEQMEVQAVSAHLAIDFNHSVSYIPEAQKVFFSEVTTLQMQQSKMYYNMETLLRGHWSKFNSNAGYVNTEEHYAKTIQAFSHWTHARTNGMIMVTDLQGIRRSNGTFLLCDPAIHSTDVLRFTRTNLGKKGFELFYNSHRCNSVCHKLKLKGSYP